jgi:hypothetical protein
VLDTQGALGDPSAKGKSIYERDSIDTGRSANLVQQGAIEGEATLGIVTKRLIGRNTSGQNMFGAEARIDMRQRPETAD